MLVLLDGVDLRDGIVHRHGKAHPVSDVSPQLLPSVE